MTSKMHRFNINLSFFLTFIISYSATAQGISRQLNLQECIGIALENNLMIKRSTLNTELSKVSLLESKASRLPNLNFGANYGNNWEFISKTIDKAFKLCNKGVIFNLISTYVDYKEDYLYYTD